jgi:hypothetical protein
VLRSAEPRGDLLLRPAASEEAQDLDLLLGEPGRPAPRRIDALPGGLAHGACGVAVEPAAIDARRDLARRLLRARRRAVCARLGHGVVRVGGSGDPRGHGQHLVAQPAVVAASVTPLVCSAASRDTRAKKFSPITKAPTAAFKCPRR